MSFIDKNNLSTFGIGFGLFIAIPLFIIVMIHFLYSDTHKTSIPKNISTSSSKYVSLKSSNYGTPREGSQEKTYENKSTSPLSSWSGESIGNGVRINKNSFLNFKNIFLLLIGIILGYIIEKSQKLI